MDELQQPFEGFVADPADIIVTEPQRENDGQTAESTAIQLANMIVIQVDVLQRRQIDQRLPWYIRHRIIPQMQRLEALQVGEGSAHELSAQ